MDNDVTMGMNEVTPKKKKSGLVLVGIIAAVLLLVIVVAFSVLNSPKVLMGILIGNTPDTARDFFEAQRGEQPLFMSESHHSETKITMAGEDFGMEGDLELEVLTAYQNDTGDFAAEMEFGMADLDAVTAGLYLSGSETALVSSILSNKYVVDLETEGELGKDTTFEERFRNLLMSSQDEELDELKERLREKVTELRKLGIKELAGATVDKGKDEIDIFGKDRNISYVEVVLDEDDLLEWAEIVLEQMMEDEELEDIIIDLAEYLNDTMLLEDDPIDTDELDLEEAFEEMLEELEELESEITIRIYRDGFTPLAYEVEYTDKYSDGECFVLLARAGDKSQLTIDFDIDGEEMYEKVFNDGDKYQYIELKADDMEYEITVEEVKSGVYEIDGTIDYGYLGEGTIEGEIIESRNETTFEITIEMESDYDKTEIEYEGVIAEEDDVTAVEASVKVIIDDEDVFKMDFESETEELKKNKEYATEGSLEITDLDMDMEYVINFENTLIYGDEAEADLPSWSEDDVYAEISDMEALEELLDTLVDDFSTGIEDVVSLIMYGGMY